MHRGLELQLLSVTPCQPLPQCCVDLLLSRTSPLAPVQPDSNLQQYDCVMRQSERGTISGAGGEGEAHGGGAGAAGARPVGRLHLLRAHVQIHVPVLDAACHKTCSDGHFSVPSCQRCTIQHMCQRVTTAWEQQARPVCLCGCGMHGGRGMFGRSQSRVCSLPVLQAEATASTHLRSQRCRSRAPALCQTAAAR